MHDVPAHHRGQSVVITYKDARDNFDSDDDCWQLDGFPCCIAKLDDGFFYIIPAHIQNDEKILDQGPFETKNAALVAITLLEQS